MFLSAIHGPFLSETNAGSPFIEGEFYATVGELHYVPHISAAYGSLRNLVNSKAELLSLKSNSMDNDSKASLVCGALVICAKILELNHSVTFT